MVTDEKSPFEYISMVDEFRELADFMDDPEIEQVLDMIVKLYIKPESIPPQKIPVLIVKLQAYSAKFQVLANLYKGLKKGAPGSDEARKKDMYYTLSDATEKLSNSVKYMARSGSY